MDIFCHDVVLVRSTASDSDGGLRGTTDMANSVSVFAQSTSPTSSTVPHRGSQEVTGTPYSIDVRTYLEQTG